ncbi:MAG: SAM-dependent methyltransferase [Lentisphaerae bacterium]|nr:SAM-dependent methyltransferase [Lentisphaerota bacterium]
MPTNKKQIKRHLEAHQFGELFNRLGWDWPASDATYPVKLGEELFHLRPVANKRGFFAYHCPCLPDSATRAKIESKLSRDVREHIIIFTDEETNKQRWQWVRRVPGQPLSRKEHEYLPNQPMLLIEKIGYLEVGMDEEENIDLIDVNDKVKSAFDIDRVTKKFYDRFKKEHDAFLGFIEGITDMGDAKWYASVMLNRLMFIYFIQKKGFLDEDTDYLRNRLAQVQELKGKGKFHTFYRYFLMKLCHEVLAKKDRTLDKELAALIGKVPYLNGGIFQPHELEIEYGEEIDIPDEAFQTIFDFFDQYEWHLDNRPAANANEINPDVLGYIFEKYINQKQMGAYYTKEDITEYIGKNTIIPCLFDKAQKSCKIAFEGETAVWNLLQADPDRYIYPAVRHGVTYDVHNDVELAEPVSYPPEIEVGLDTTKPNLLERRKEWNTPTPPEAGLPTEIWRETVARRQRYAEVRGKLERGEVRSINDLITLNLDIRQFAQDVIERCESPDLLNAFWVAIAGRLPQNSKEEIKPGITVLDPTCGSGAFLFAALNILEPLYEACLERMKGFLEEWESSATVPVASTGETPMPHSKHPRYAAFFKSICDDIDKHPSDKYFIYKSIIIHNLYGVDIMKEAVEICKLRLFLKLVAQVEDGTRIEPLPDIDFNIRAGNTLVGFATQEEMKCALQGDLLAYSTVLPEILEQAEECDRLFNLFREAQLEGDRSLPKAKKTLQDKLAALNERLNIYLAQDYGIDVSSSVAATVGRGSSVAAGGDRGSFVVATGGRGPRSATSATGKSDLRSPASDFRRFLETHQPFHWFIEFYGIMKSGGFDAIIGNPPYLDLKQLKDYKLINYATLPTKNLYSLVIERCDSITNGRQGYIVPISSTATEGYIPLQQVMLRRLMWFSSFDDRPAHLFDGLDKNTLSIILLAEKTSSPSITSSRLNRWGSEERSFLFAQLQSYTTPSCVLPGCLPRVSTELEFCIWGKVFNANSPIVASLSRTGSAVIYYSRKVNSFLQILDFIPEVRDGKGDLRPPSEFKTMSFSSIDDANAVFCTLNSSLFRWFMDVVSDGSHLNRRETDLFPLDLRRAERYANKFEELALALSADLKKNSFKRKMTYKHDTLTVQCIIPKNSKPIIDEIDKVLAEHYGFTEEELDYIINYDIKYRMGKDLQEDSSDD